MNQKLVNSAPWRLVEFLAGAKNNKMSLTHLIMPERKCFKSERPKEK